MADEYSLALYNIDTTTHDDCTGFSNNTPHLESEKKNIVQTKGDFDFDLPEMRKKMRFSNKCRRSNDSKQIENYCKFTGK